MTRLASLASDRATPSASYASLFINHQTLPRSTALDRRSSIGACGLCCKRWLSGHEDCRNRALTWRLLNVQKRSKGGGGEDVPCTDCVHRVGWRAMCMTPASSFHFLKPSSPPQQTNTKMKIPTPASPLSASSYIHHQVLGSLASIHRGHQCPLQRKENNRKSYCD